MERKKKSEKRKIRIVVLISTISVLALALIITNFFIPILYFTAYIHFKKDINPLGQLRVRYLDVGYGDSTLVELPDGKTMLIDGGTGTYGNVYKLLDTLNSSGIDTVDYLVCTSVKSEHCAALTEILKHKSIVTAYVPYVTNVNITDEYADFYSRLQKSGISIETAEYGKGVYSSESDYFFCILSPSVKAHVNSEYHTMNASPTSANINNASIVLWLEYAGTSFMFLSDVGSEVQAKIADTILLENSSMVVDGTSVSLTQCNVLKVANHGKDGYSSPALYGLLQVEAAIISVGKNAQSSPANTEIAFIQQHVGNNFYRTDTDGTVTVVVNSDNYSISKENS